MPERTDEELFIAYRGGDDTALRTLIERHHDALMRFLYRLLGDREAADDVFQEAFLQVHLRGHTFDTTRRFRPWLFTIAANKGRDYLRTKNRKRTLDLSAAVGGQRGDDGVTFVDLLEASVDAPETALNAEDTERMVQRALQSLSPTLRETLLLAYFQGLTYAQIAEDLDIPLGTVKSRLHAAVASFGNAWKNLARQTK